MKVKTVVVGPLQVNTYIVYDPLSLEAVIIDPGDEPDMIIDAVNELGVKVKYIICTHGHFDHIGAIIDIKDETKAPVLLHQDEHYIYSKAKEASAIWGFNTEDQPTPDKFLADADEISVSGFTLKVIHTPGHSPGSICLYDGKVLFSGDTLFEGSIGRTDFVGGDMQLMRKSLQKLMQLPDDTIVYPGHGDKTTISQEKRLNPFCRGEL